MLWVLDMAIVLLVLELDMVLELVPRHSSVPPSIQGKEGEARALLKLQNSTVSANYPFCPIYSTIGIHPVMKGYWPIIKISGRH
jgi:hypothetical protein